MINEPILDLVFAIYSCLIGIVFGIMYRKRGAVFLWALASLLSAVASVFFYLRHFDPNYRIL